MPDPEEMTPEQFQEFLDDIIECISGLRAREDGAKLARRAARAIEASGHAFEDFMAETIGEAEASMGLTTASAEEIPAVREYIARSDPLFRMNTLVGMAKDYVAMLFRTRVMCDTLDVYRPGAKPMVESIWEALRPLLVRICTEMVELKPAFIERLDTGIPVWDDELGCAPTAPKREKGSGTESSPASRTSRTPSDKPQAKPDKSWWDKRSADETFTPLTVTEDSLKDMFNNDFNWDDV